MDNRGRREWSRGGSKGAAARSALLLKYDVAPCVAGCCGSVAGMLRKNPAIDRLHEAVGGGDAPGIVPPFAPDVVVLRLRGYNGTRAILSECKSRWPEASILALFCPALQESDEQCAFLLDAVADFLSCPFREGELALRLQRILGPRSARRPDGETATADRRQSPALPMVGGAESFLRLVDKIPLLAECGTTVLIAGETGTGKEVFARAIHYQSRRRGKPFVPVNCGALPDHLFENELFGHAKGAFTDASSSEKGLIAEAEGGTLFLDEIDTLSSTGQVKLLRFLQDGEYRAVGAPRALNADVRVIAATNADLKARVESRMFREDLYYRLNFLSLSLPPLRERLEDVAALAEHFLRRYAAEHGQTVRAIEAAAMDKMMAYDWPGNVRELESIITRALTFSRGRSLAADDIELPVAYCPERVGGGRLREAKSHTIAAFERRYLAGLLAQHQGNVTQAARAAGKERRSFQRLLRKHNLDRQTFHP